MTHPLPRVLKRRGRPGFSLLEGLLAVVLFVVVMLPLFRLYSETGISQQKMIRDYAVAINIAENALNLIENEIDRGTITPAFDQQDVTDIVLGNASAQAAISQFLGEGSSGSTKYMPRFRLFLTAKPAAGIPQLIEITLRFAWGNFVPGQTFTPQHEFVLSSMKCRR